MRLGTQPSLRSRRSAARCTLQRQVRCEGALLVTAGSLAPLACNI